MIEVGDRLAGGLSLLAAALAVGVLVALARGRVPDWWRRDWALPLALAVAGTATLGSLWMSEVAGYVPCELCWYQRIAMYPLTIVLAVALWRDDREVWRTAVPLASAGGLVSIWHVTIERMPGLAGPCDPAAPCTVRWVEELGVLTLPAMALIGFVAVIALTLSARPEAASDRAAAEPATDGA